MTARSKSSKEERERVRRIGERDRQIKLRRKQLDEFMEYLAILFHENDRMKRDLHDEAFAPPIGDKAPEGAWDLRRPNPDLVRRKCAVAEAIDEFEKLILEKYREFFGIMHGFEREDDEDCEKANAEWAASPEGQARDALIAAYEAARKVELDAMDRRQAVIDALLRGDKPD